MKRFGIQAAIYAVLALTAMLMVESAKAGCQWQWIDHDWNSATDPIWDQVCTDPLDTPAIEPAQPVEPLQTTGLRPVDQSNLVIPPPGTETCEQSLTYDTESRQWYERIICR